MADHTGKTTTLVARRTNESGGVGATIGSFRCTDTGALVLTNTGENPRSPYTGGELSRVNPTYKMTLNQDQFDELAHVGQCPNPDCGVELYTQAKMRVDDAGTTQHCTACGHGFVSPELSDEEIAEFKVGGDDNTKKKTAQPATEGADMGMSTGGPTADANKPMGTNYDDSSSSSDSDSSSDGPDGSSSSDSDSDGDDFAGDVMLLDDSDADGNGDASELDNPDDSDDDPAIWASTPEDWAALAASTDRTPKGKAKMKSTATTGDPLAKNPGDFVSNNSPGGEPTPEGHDTLTPHANAFPKTIKMKTGPASQTMPVNNVDTCALDDSMMLMLHGMIALSVEEDPANAGRFNAVDAALAGVNGTKVDMTGEQTTDAATCFAMALEQAGDNVDTIEAVFDAIEGAQDNNPRSGLEAALAAVGTLVSAPVVTAWNQLTDLLSTASTEATADATGATTTVAETTDDGATGASAQPAAAPAATVDATAQASDAGATGATAAPAATVDATGATAAPATASAEVTPPAVPQMIAVDVSATVDFDPRTLVVNQIVPGGYGVFATVEGHLTPIGVLEAVAASESNRSMFAENKIDLIRRALVASCESEEGNLGDLGFRPITAQIDAAVIRDDEVAARVEAASVENAAVARTAVEGYQHGLQIAVAGMTKGVYASPMVDRLSNELKRRGVVNAGLLANRMVASAMNETMSVVFAKAGEFAGMSTAELNAVAKTINDMNPAEVEDAPAVDFSTASIETPMVERESATVIPMERSSGNVFAGVGYGGGMRR